MKLNTLTALSPIDGRYAQRTELLRPVLSEFGLIHHRLQVEVQWLLCMSQRSDFKEVPTLSKEAQTFLTDLVTNFNLHDAQQIKDIEQVTNHDVKACEYFLKQACAEHPELSKVSEFFHFACTSEDINNLAYALMLKKTRDEFVLPWLDKIIQQCQTFSRDYACTPMLAHTHGQPASPTTIGKEFAVMAQRLIRAKQHFSSIAILGKFNGATGNFNAHLAAYPDAPWRQISQDFIQSLGLTANAYTTQIESHDYVADLAHSLMRLHTILIDLNRDCWGYISKGYFKQRTLEHEVGSSTMPHKVNPIDFENSEGNLTLSNALFTCLANQLPISRWQRDLVDSTLLRNIAPAMSHAVIAYQSLLKGLSKLDINNSALQTDLDNNWEVLAEAIQTVMRRYDVESPYEKLKELTRGRKIDKTILYNFIDGLDIPNNAKEQLQRLTPEHYTGLASDLALEASKLDDLANLD